MRSKTKFWYFRRNTNQINLISEKLDLIDKDFQSRISQIEKIDLLEKKDKDKKMMNYQLRNQMYPQRQK